MGEVDTRAWAVVETKPNAETIAERSLERLGFEPFVPRYNKLIKGCRIEPNGRRIRSREDTVVLRPFLPGYLFLPVEYGDDAMLADADHGWGKPLGVKRVLRQRMDEYGRARPRFVRASIVEGIRIAIAALDEMPRSVRQDLWVPFQQHARAAEKASTGQQLTADEKAALIKGPVRVRHPLGFVVTLRTLDDHGRSRWFGEWLNAEREGTFEDTSTLELVEA